MSMDRKNIAKAILKLRIAFDRLGKNDADQREKYLSMVEEAIDAINVEIQLERVNDIN